MAKEVDTKVVEMVFDNKDFEKGVKETRQSISGLQESITNLSDSADGTQSVEKVNKVVIDKMSVLASAVNTTVSRITNTVIDGVSKVSSKVNELTIAPVSSGYKKYEEQVESVQTIMNATGKSIDDVTEQLEKLMWYTDETSYSYTDMASNIGKFTSAGVDLDDAVTAMMGIANWAGVSGANVQQASRAMYNLSQAMGTGSLKLQDWMSIENANMATKEFKQTLIDTAKELGVLSEDTEITAENMRDTLKDGWVTSDVLTKALAKYGNYTEELYKIHQSGIESVDEAAEEYKKKYADIIDTLTDAYEKYGEKSEEFQKIIKENSLSTQTAMDLISEKAAERFNKNLETIAEKLKETANAYGYESKEFAEQAKNFGYSIKDAAKMVEEGIDSFKMADVSLGEKSFSAAQEAKTFKDAWEATIDAVSTQWLRFWDAVFGNYEEAKEMWTDLSMEMWEVFAEPVSKLADIAEAIEKLGGRANVLEGLSNAWEAMKKTINAVKTSVQQVWPAFQNGKSIATTVYALTVRFKEWSENIDTSKEKLQGITNVCKNFLNVGKSLAEIIYIIGHNIIRIIEHIIPSSEDVFGFVADSLEDMAQIEDHVATIGKVITNIATGIIVGIELVKLALKEGFNFITNAVSLILGVLLTGIYTIATSDIFKAIVNVIAAVFNIALIIAVTVGNTIYNIFIGISELLIGISDFINDMAKTEDKWKTMMKWLGELDFYVGAIKVVLESIIKTFQVFGIVIKEFMEGIGEFFSSVDTWKASFIVLVLMLISNAAGLVVIIAKVFSGIVSVLKSLFSPVRPLKLILQNFLSEIAETVNSLLGIIDVAKLEAVGKLILNYAIAVAILSVAAMELSRIDPDVFWTAIEGLGVMVLFTLAFVALCDALMVWQSKSIASNLSGLPKEIQSTVKSFIQIGTLLIGFAGIINAMANLLEIVGTVWKAVEGDTKSFFIVLAGMGVLIVALFVGVAAFTRAVQVSEKESQNASNNLTLELKSISGNITDIAVAIVGVAAALAVLTFVNPDNLLQAAIILGAFAVYFILITIGMKKIAKAMSKFDEQKKKDNIDVPDIADYIEAMAMGLKSIAFAFVGMAASLLAFSFIDPHRMNSVIVTFALVSAAAIVMIWAFGNMLTKITSTYDMLEESEENLDKNSESIFENSTKKDSKLSKMVTSTGVMVEHIQELGKAISKIMGSMSIMMLAMMPLAAMNPESILNAGFAVALVMGLVAAIMFGMALLLEHFSGDSEESKKLDTTLDAMANRKAAALENTKSLEEKTKGINGEDLKDVGKAFLFIGLSCALIAQSIVPLALLDFASEWVTNAYNNTQIALEHPELTVQKIDILGKALSTMLSIIAALTGMVILILTFIKTGSTKTLNDISDSEGDGAIATENIEKITEFDTDALKAVGIMMIEIAGAMAIIGATVAGLAGLHMIPGMAESLWDSVYLIGVIWAIVGALILEILLLTKDMREPVEAEGESEDDAEDDLEDAEEDVEKKKSIFEELGNLLMQIAKMIGIIAVSMSLLTGVGIFSKNTFDQYFAGVAALDIALGLVGLIIFLFMTSLKKLYEVAEPEKLEYTSDIIDAIGNTFLKLGGAMLMISAAMALASFVATKTPLKSLNVVLTSMGVFFLEISAALGVIFYFAKDVEDADKMLLAIAGSIAIMASAMVILAFAFMQMEKLGDNILPMMGYFAVIMAIFGVYEVVMLMMLKEFNHENASDDWKTLLAVAAQYVAFAGAIVLIVPALERLMEATDRLGGTNLAAAAYTIIGLISIMALIAGALMESAKLGNLGSWGSVSLIAAGATMIELAAAVVILAGALKVLAEVDFWSLAKGLFAVAVVFVEFVGTAILLATVVKTFGPYVATPIIKLGLAFMLFGASLWLTAIAFRTFTQSLHDIASNEDIQLLAEQLAKYPDALNAIVTALGVSLGSILLKAIITFVFGQAAFNKFFELLKTFAGNLISQIGAWLTASFESLAAAAGMSAGAFGAAIGALLASAALVVYAIVTGWDEDNAFYRTGQHIAQAIKNGTTDELSGFDKVVGTLLDPVWRVGDTILAAEGWNEADLTKQQQKYEADRELYKHYHLLTTWNDESALDWFRETYPVYNGYDSSLLSDEIFKNMIIEDIQAKLDKGSVNQNFWEEAYQEAMLEYYDKQEAARKEAEAEAKVKAAEEASKAEDKRWQTYRENRYAWEAQQAAEAHQKELENIEETKAKGAEIRAQQKQAREEAVAAVVEQYTAEKKYSDEKVTRIMAEGEVRGNVETQIKAYQEAEAERNAQLAEINKTRYMDHNEYENYLAQKKAENAEAEKASNEEIAARAKELSEEAIEEHKKQKEAQDDITDAVNNTVTVDGLRTQEIQNQNDALADQLTLEQLINSVKSDGLNGIASILGSDKAQDLVTDAIGGKLGDYLNNSKDNILNSIADTAGINKSVFDSFFDMLGDGIGVTDAIDKLSEDSGTKSALSDILSQLTSVVGIDLTKLSEFDISDPINSLKKLVNIDTEKGKSIIKDYLGIDLDADEVSLEAVSQKLFSFLNLGDMFSDLSDKFKVDYEPIDYSKLNLVDGEQLLEAAGASDASAYANGFSNTLDYNSLLNPTTDEVTAAEEAAAARGEAEVTAYQNAYDKALEAAKKAAEAETKEENEAQTKYEESFRESTSYFGDATKLDITKMETSEVNQLRDFYLRHYNFLSKQVKNLDAEYKNEDGSWKDTITESQKKYYESVDKELQEYKANYEYIQSAIETENKARDERRQKAAFKAMYKDNSEQLQADIDAKRDEIAGYKAQLLSGELTLSNEDKIQGALDLAVKYLAQLEAYQKEQNEELNAEIAENGEEGETFADPYSAAAKAARKESKEQIKDYKQQMEEADWWITQLEGIPEAQRNEWQKKQLEKYKSDYEQAEINYKQAANLYNSLLPDNYDLLQQEIEHDEERLEYLKGSLNAENVSEAKRKEILDEIGLLETEIEKDKKTLERVKSLFIGSDEEMDEEAVSAETAISNLTTNSTAASTSLGDLSTTADELTKKLSSMTNLSSVVDTEGITKAVTDATANANTTDATKGITDAANSLTDATKNLPKTSSDKDNWLNSESSSYTTVSTKTNKTYGIKNETVAGHTIQNANYTSTYMSDIYGKVVSIDSKISDVLTKLSDITTNQDTLNYAIANSTNTICNDGVNVNVINGRKIINRIASDVDSILGKKAYSAIRGN